MILIISLNPPSKPVELRAFDATPLGDEETEAGEHRLLVQGHRTGECQSWESKCLCGSQTFALSQFQVPFSGRYRATDLTLYGFVCCSFLREQPAEILIGLGNSFSEIFFKLHL